MADLEMGRETQDKRGSPTPDALDLCFCVATRESKPVGVDLRSPRFGGQVVEYGSAVFITAEESEAALHRRLEHMDPQNQREGNHRLLVVSLRDRPGTRSLIRGKNEAYAPSSFAYQLLAELLEIPDLKLVVLDPVSALFGADPNDRTAVQAFCDIVSHIATETGATSLRCTTCARVRTIARAVARTSSAVAGSSTDSASPTHSN